MSASQKGSVYLRRSPFLISYWLDNQLVFENYLTRKKVSASPQVTAILDFFTGWTKAEETFHHWPQYSPDSLLKAVGRLLRETLLEGSRRKNPPEAEPQKALRKWGAWNPAAGFFHLSTKDIYAKEVTPEEIAFIEQLAKTHTVPKPLKAYPGARAIPLKRGDGSGEFSRVLRDRRTWREFSRREVALGTLSTLLDLSFAVQAWENVPTIGRLAQKTSPSGGALHPSEAYVLTRRVEGVAQGIYHYDAGGHRLQRLKVGASAAEIQRYLAGQWWFRDAAFVVFLTAVFGRTQWKYDYARAYRAILIEAGHLCQTFCLTATWLGLAPFCTIALADTQIEKSLGLDGISESVIYAMGAGHKPDKK
ncbi:MAG TPA: SagB family peptide dehydrogenase [Candidatus Acidoferrum sp.]|nr:SagB family peptide dehydrogenase [Candidatus Acidoferrum sp.]